MYGIGHGRSRARLRAFTLVELIVVVIVLGLLLAVALPNFFGASTAAQDSAARQYLTISYKDLKSAIASNDGNAVTAASAVSALTSAEPQLAFVSSAASSASNAAQKLVFVEQTGTGYRLGIHSASSALITLTADRSTGYAPVFSGGTGGAVGGGFTTPANTSPPILTGTATDAQLLSVSAGTWSGSAPSSYAYAWQSSADGGTTWTTIGAQTANTYMLSGTDINKLLRAQVTPLDSGSNPLTTAASSAASAAVSPGTGTLTVSGGLITDATRATYGDGLSADSSTGIWEGTTNLVTNGGFETNTGGWSSLGDVGTPTVTRDTSQFKFGTASLKVTSAGIANYAASNSSSAISGATAGRVFTASEWLYGTGATVGRTYQFELYETGGASGTAITIANGTIVAGWQRITATRTIVQNDRTGIVLHSYVLGAAGAGETFYIDGVQVEEKPVATPYVETSTAAASRAAARVQASASLLNTTQGWIAMRVRMGFASNAAPHPYPILFNYNKDGSNRIDGSYAGSGVWRVDRFNGGQDLKDSTTASFAAGDTITLVCAWTATQLSISINGSAFSSVTTIQGVPSGFTSLDLGTFGGTGNELDSGVLWSAGGTGPVTNTDASTLSALGNSDPTVTSLPGTARTTFAWNGVGTAYQTATWAG